MDDDDFFNLFDDEEDGQFFDPQPGNSNPILRRSGYYIEERPKHGFCGLANQGATCYLNSLLQCLYLTPEIRLGLYELSEAELGIEFMEEPPDEKDGQQADKSADAAKTFIPDEKEVEALAGMGFPTAHCIYALRQFPSASADGRQESALNMLLSGDSIPEEELKQQEILLSASKSSTGKAYKVPIMLRRLFARLQESNQLATHTRDLTWAFGWSGNESSIQHDIHELNRVLVDALHRSLAKTSKASLVHDVFGGSATSTVRCNECGKSSERHEDFLDLSVQVKGHSTLEESLAAYVAQDELVGSNQYRCHLGCGGKKTDGVRGTSISKLPQVLTLALVRFEMDWSKGVRKKITGNFRYPLVLDMAPYTTNASDTGSSTSFESSTASTATDTACSSDADDKARPKDKKNLQYLLHPPKNRASPHLYRLAGVLIHQGTAYGGHYHCYIRDVTGVGTVSEEFQNANPPYEEEPCFWFDFNDSSVSPIPLLSLCKQYGGDSECAYMLVYRRVDAASPKLPLPKDLAARMLQLNSEIAKDREEYIKAKHALKLHVFLEPAFQVIGSSLLDVHQGSNQCDDESKVVQPYRKTLNTDSRSSVSDFIAELCEAFCAVPGQDSQMQWAEQPHELADPVATKALLERSALTTLRRRGNAQLPEVTLRDRIDLSEQNNTLGDLPLAYGCELLLWNGQSVNGVPVVVDDVEDVDSSEQIHDVELSLHVFRPEHGPESKSKPDAEEFRISAGPGQPLQVPYIAKSNYTMDKLVHTVMKRLGWDAHLTASTTWFAYSLFCGDINALDVNSEDHLADLRVGFGADVAIAFSASSGAADGALENVCLEYLQWLQRVFRVSVLLSPELLAVLGISAAPSLALELQSSATVSEAYQAVGALVPQLKDHTHRLRCMHGPSQLGGLLVSSDQTLAKAGLEDRGYIRLELGPLPTSLELDVLVTLVHNQKRVLDNVPIMLQRKHSIKQCKQVILDTAGLAESVNQFCLYRPERGGTTQGKVLRNEFISISKLRLRSGAHLWMEEGKLPVTGIVKLQVSLLPYDDPAVIIQKFFKSARMASPSASSGNDAEDASTLETTQKLDQMSIRDETTLVDSNFEFSCELRLSDLKQALHSVELLSTAPSPEHLRVRLLTRGLEAGKVVSLDDVPVRNQGIPVDKPIGVQILPHAESGLGKNALVLHLFGAASRYRANATREELLAHKAQHEAEQKRLFTEYQRRLLDEYAAKKVDDVKDTQETKVEDDSGTLEHKTSDLDEDICIEDMPGSAVWSPVQMAPHAGVEYVFGRQPATLENLKSGLSAVCGLPLKQLVVLKWYFKIKRWVVLREGMEDPVPKDVPKRGKKKTKNLPKPNSTSATEKKGSTQTVGPPNPKAVGRKGKKGKRKAKAKTSINIVTQRPFALKTGDMVAVADLHDLGCTTTSELIVKLEEVNWAPPPLLSSRDKGGRHRRRRAAGPSAGWKAVEHVLKIDV